MSVTTNSEFLLRIPVSDNWDTFREAAAGPPVYDFGAFNSLTFAEPFNNDDLACPGDAERVRQIIRAAQTKKPAYNFIYSTPSGLLQGSDTETLRDLTERNFLHMLKELVPVLWNLVWSHASWNYSGVVADRPPDSLSIDMECSIAQYNGNSLLKRKTVIAGHTINLYKVAAHLLTSILVSSSNVWFSRTVSSIHNNLLWAYKKYWDTVYNTPFLVAADSKGNIKKTIVNALAGLSGNPAVTKYSVVFWSTLNYAVWHEVNSPVQDYNVMAFSKWGRVSDNPKAELIEIPREADTNAYDVAFPVHRMYNEDFLPLVKSVTHLNSALQSPAPLGHSTIATSMAFEFLHSYLREYSRKAAKKSGEAC